MTAAVPREPIGHGEPKACPLARRLGGEKRLERPRGQISRHPLAGVANGQDDKVAGLQSQGFRRNAIQADIVAPQAQSSATWHGVTGVDGEVQKRVLHLAGVRARGPNPLDALNNNGDVSAHRAADGVFQTQHKTLEVHAAKGQRLPPREGQKPASQSAGARAEIKGDAEIVPSLRDLGGGDACLIQACLCEIQTAGAPCRP